MKRQVLLLCAVLALTAGRISAQITIDRQDVQFDKTVTTTFYPTNDVTQLTGILNTPCCGGSYLFDAPTYDPSFQTKVEISSMPAFLPGWDDPELGLLADYVMFNFDIQGVPLVGDTYVYFDDRNEGLYILGLVGVADIDGDGTVDEMKIKYRPPSLTIPLPLTMGSKWTSTYRMWIETNIPGFPSLEVAEVMNTTEVDQHGTLVTPAGSAPCLRLKTTSMVTPLTPSPVTPTPGTNYDWITEEAVLGAHIHFVNTGAPTGLYSVLEGVTVLQSVTTVQANVDAAASSANAWAADARLMAVGLASRGGVTADGMGLTWKADYYSPSADEGRSFFVSESMVVRVDTLTADDFLSLDPLPGGWVDSPGAAQTAETNSGDFRTQHPDAVVTAVLSRGQRADDAERAVWRFTYTSEQDDTSLTIDIDAETGEVIQTGTVVEAEPGVPDAFALEPNYPNPFNPSTAIPFAVAEPGPVTLRVYDVLGREVTTLVDAFLPIGRYTVTWQAETLPSGLYLYRLRTNEGMLIRTMTLLR